MKRTIILLAALLLVPLAALHAADASGARLEVMRTLARTHLIP